MVQVPHNVMRSVASTVLSELAAVDAIAHPGENGRARETILRTFLKSFVPPAFGIDTGFVIDAHGGISKQIDVIVYRTGYHPVFEIGGVKHFMIESVAAAIENKARIQSVDVLEQALSNVRSVKELDRTGGGRNYVVADFHVRGPTVSDDPARYAILTAIIGQHVMATDSFAAVMASDMNTHPRRVWLDSFCAIHDFTTLYLIETESGQREHKRWITEEVNLLAMVDAETGEAPLVEFAGMLADRLRAMPIIDFDPRAYFPSAMKHRTIVRTEDLQTPSN